MRTLTLEGIYRNGLVEIQEKIKFKGPMRVLVVFIDEYKPKRKLVNKFSFAKSLELTKNCKGTLSEVIINERRSEKW
jgi:hypothetical protein